MHTKRIIPCLDVKDGRVVKGINFVNLKDAGDPVAVGAAYDLADNKCCFMADENSPESLAENIMKVFDKGDLTHLCLQQYQMYSVEKMEAGFFNAFKEAIK